MAQFIPRAIFPPQSSLPRSYFLGHHASGLSKMKTMLSSIDLIVECRDYRVPLTSRNPLFEQALAGRERIIVYTKKDLGSKDMFHDKMREETIRTWHKPHPTLFTSHTSSKDIKTVLQLAKEYALQKRSLLGTRIMIVGMPNVGKSSLLNALRKQSLNNSKKAAITGAQPGVTRKIATGVKIMERDEEQGIEAVYFLDTPGVFIPYVPDAEAMMKLALCGSVKDTVISPVTLCDYLLFHINNQASPFGPELYKEYSNPTNDIVEFLEAVCRKTGRLGKGAVPDVDAAALWIIQRWRQGHLGRFLLDVVDEDSLEREMEGRVGTSISQARKAAKEVQRERGRARQAARSGGGV